MFGLDKYNYFTNISGFDFEFESIGTKGIIKKVARFTLIESPFIYNFGFGDLDENTGDINDTISSNNGDQDKIMGTLGSIIFDFTTLNSDAQIYIEGTNATRTRLYQMSITKYWNQIDLFFEVYGLKQDKWYLFEKGINYEAFIGRRKTAF
jgi:hypothetical protein